MADANFLSWRRRGGTAIGAVPVGGRPEGTLKLTARDSSGGEIPAAVSFLLYGPGDVTGLHPGAVTARYPRPGQTDAEGPFRPYAELADPDLPWRYSPRGVQDAEMQPWLQLLVVEPTEIERIGGAVMVSADALQKHGTSPARAHVQETEKHEVGRVICLRDDIEDEKDYLALLVPAFDEDGNDWNAARPFPVYDEWSFRTSETGTFETLAEALHAADEQENFGRITVALGETDDEKVHVRGALTGIHDTSDPPPAANATTRLEALLDFDPDPEGGHGFDAAGRRYVRPPNYGDAWLERAREGAPPAGWVAQLNDDPTHRVVGGLGLQAGIDLQDEIASAAARLGTTAAANQRLAALGAGLAVARSLWDRRIAPLPAAEPRIRVLGLAAGRVLAKDPADGTVRPLLELASGPDRTLPAALFSTAARRVLRPNAARLRYAKPRATTILDAANAPRPTVRRPEKAPDDPRYHDGVASVDTLIADLRAELGSFRIRGRDVTRADDLVPALEVAQHVAVGAHLKQALGRLHIEQPPRAVPRPVDLVALDDALVRAFDPRGDSAAVARVRATIDPDDPQPLAPREPCPDLDLPAWRYLRDRQREWLLPGAHTLSDGEVVGLASNPLFADAFLVGMNTQALGELRWRNMTVATGCTPLRRFWDRSAGDGDAYAPDYDIEGILKWVGTAPDGSDRRAAPLGAPLHRPRGEDGRQLVVVFCTDLFRRYPGTLVYLAPPTGDWADADLSQRVLPAFSARVTAKLVLYAFPKPPEALEQFWVVVEQQPPGFRFNRVNDPGNAASPAARAAKMLVQPVRVLLAGPTLVAGPA
jgi:hypothetical protein